jgi:NADPH-dependent ferric siderophore reductase
VTAVADLSPHLRRVTFTGNERDDLHGLVPEEPAASIRVLLPSEPDGPLVIPTWNGNEFLLPDGARPVIRTLTPLRSDAGALDVAIVLHDGGAASAWAAAARPGLEVAISGPGRGYQVRAAPAFLLGGDETALPAIGQLLATIPADGSRSPRAIAVHVEVARPEARLALPVHPAATVTWHDLPPGAVPGAALVAAVSDAAIASDARVWAAGEAAAVQQIRRHLFEVRRIPRPQTSVRGSWKQGRAESSDLLRDA